MAPASTHYTRHIAAHITSDALFLQPSVQESQVSPGRFHHSLAVRPAGCSLICPWVEIANKEGLI